MSGFADHCSLQAERYARFRPTYPPALFEFLASVAPARNLAWDCATGNGQAAVGLALHFEQVLATEPSPRQLASRTPHPRVAYVRSTAADSGLASGAAALLTVAQALHWFAGEPFFREARRVLEPGGIVAAWAYNLLTVSAEVDSPIHAFEREVVGPYWPPERCYFRQGYHTVPFPFVELPAPTFAMEHDWTLDDALGYLSTWSSVVRYRIQRGQDPLPALAEELAPRWGDGRRRVSFPLLLRLGRV
jgi:SAM-dependent methyltransferase